MGVFDGGGKMGKNSTQSGAGGPSGTGGASKGGKGSAGGSYNGGGPGANRGQYRPGMVTNSGQMITGEVTSYGAPVRQNKYGVKTALPETATPGKPAQAWGSWKDQVGTYNKAAEKWNAGAGPSFGNVVNNMSPYGFSMQAPDLNRPKTYTGGDYHLGVNPAELAGGLLSMYGSGLISGPMAGKVYTAMGGQNVMLGGPDVPGGWDPKGAGAAVPNQAQGNGVSGAQNMAGAFSNTGGGGNAVAQQPGGASFGAQPTTMASAQPTPAAQGMFTPQLPNHTLPKDYASMFPNSLSEQDKALLYAKALGGMG